MDVRACTHVLAPVQIPTHSPPCRNRVWVCVRVFVYVRTHLWGQMCSGGRSRWAPLESSQRGLPALRDVRAVGSGVQRSSANNWGRGVRPRHSRSAGGEAGMRPWGEADVPGVCRWPGVATSWSLGAGAAHMEGAPHAIAAAHVKGAPWRHTMGAAHASHGQGCWAALCPHGAPLLRSTHAR